MFVGYVPSCNCEDASSSQGYLDSNASKEEYVKE